MRFNCVNVSVKGREEWRRPRRPDRGLYEIAFILIRSGKASAFERTAAGWTARHFAAKGCHDDVLGLLMPTTREVWNASTNDRFTADNPGSSLFSRKTCLHFAALYESI
jgi:hypothetical protein